MNRSSQNIPPTASQAEAIADAKIDAALETLNSVQPAARLEQRIHARLAQKQEAAAADSAWSGSFEKIAALFSWPRAAFALATFTAGVLAATLGLPLLRHPATEPATASHTPAATPASAGTNSTGAVAAEPAAVHPGFTVRTPDGRAAALNTLGTVATVRSRNAHSDTQFASRQSDHVHAKLAKPARPKAGQPTATSDDQPAAAPADNKSPQSTDTPAASPNNQ